MAKLPIEKMRELERRFSEVEARMSAGPAADVYIKLAAEYSELEPVVKKIREFQKTESEIADLETLLADRATDREMRELAEMELPELKARIETLEGEMQILLLPKDAADEKSAILEIRAGTVATKLRFSPATYSECTSGMPRHTAGRLKSSPKAKVRRAATRKSLQLSAGAAFLRS